MSLAEQPVPKRLDYIDFMNIFACFGVVCLHCSGLVFCFSETRAWFAAMFVQTVFHFAVPVFFMISGTTLLEYRARYSTKAFFKKRFTKTGIPFVFWSLFYLLVPTVFGKAPLPTFEAVRNGIFNNGANNVFWFFYVIFASIFLCRCFPNWQSPKIFAKSHIYAYFPISSAAFFRVSPDFYSR